MGHGTVGDCRGPVGPEKASLLQLFLVATAWSRGWASCPVLLSASQTVTWSGSRAQMVPWVLPGRHGCSSHPATCPPLPLPQPSCSASVQQLAVLVTQRLTPIRAQHAVPHRYLRHGGVHLTRERTPCVDSMGSGDTPTPLQGAQEGATAARPRLASLQYLHLLWVGWRPASTWSYRR